MLKKMMRLVLSRTFAFALLALVQVGIFVVLVFMFANTGALAYTILTIVTVLVLVAILEKDDLNPAYKLMWTLIIVLMPLSGTLFYLLWGHRHVPRRLQRRFDEIEQRAKHILHQDKAPLAALAKKDRQMFHSARYLLKYANSPVYAGCQVEYYRIGEVFFPRFLQEIRKAKKFIFLEYFIMEEGYMWDTTLAILRQKVAEGVDVRLIYDGFGSLFTLPAGYEKKMREYGIQCYVFGPLTFTPHVSDYAMLNHRDHRKITAIDGNIAFSGGLNFADEYINKKLRFGVWKDTAFMLCGEAAFSLTVTFLKAWDYVSGQKTDFMAYKPTLPPPLLSEQQMLEKGLVQPYYDTPLDGENVSENAYLKIIAGAQEYVYISTPYLVLDNEMITSLTLAAKSGVDVRILTPGIPDKPTVFVLTQSYYPALLRAGVRIYEYTPGFNHAKMYVSDDKTAIIGSANMDYRSLYLHFENCVSFYGGPIVQQAKQDMLESFACGTEITLEDTRRISLPKRLVQVVARFFAPML